MLSKLQEDTQNVVLLILLSSLWFYKLEYINIISHWSELATVQRLAFLCCPLSVSLTSSMRKQHTDLTANPFVQDRNSLHNVS